MSIVAAVMVVSFGHCVLAIGHCETHKTTTPSLKRSDADYMEDIKLGQKLNMSTFYDMLYKLRSYNYTTEDRVQILEKSIPGGRIGVDWVYDDIVAKFRPYIENLTAKDHVHLRKVLKVFPGFAALPKASGRFRAWHGRFTNLSRMRLGDNVTYSAIDNQVLFVGHVRMYNATFVYRNYELEVNDKITAAGAITGSYDFIDYRMTCAWVTKPRCKLMYALNSLYDYVGCNVNLKRLGEYQYMNIELGITTCQIMDTNLRAVLEDYVTLYWEKAANDALMCKNVVFKDTFGVAMFV